MKIRGECLCHGVIVEGEAGTVAQPRPYYRSTDPFGRGPRVKCWAVLENGRGMPHDVPIDWPRGVERFTDVPTTVMTP